MQPLLDAPGGDRWLTAIAVSGVALFIFAIAVLMAPYAPVMGERRSEMQCLQVAFTSARAERVIAAFDARERQAMAGLLIPGDLGLAWGYGLLLAGIIGLLARRLDAAWQRAGAIAMWLPITAAAFDCVEDAFLYSIVVGAIDNPGAGVAPLLPLLGGVAALIKYSALSVLTPAYAVAGVVRGMRVNRRIGALAVYGVALLVSLTFAVPPFRSLPSCF